MKIRLIAACILAGLISVSPAAAAVLIAGDAGGRIDRYIDKFETLRASGEQVVIDGPCLSACTLVLSAIPRDRICVTPRASLGFHAAWQFGRSGTPVRSPEGTELLWAAYPTHVRQWITRKGGLRTRMIYLRGRELAAMYQPCQQDMSAARRM
jgi:hypothetical protein